MSCPRTSSVAIEEDDGGEDMEPGYRGHQGAHRGSTLAADPHRALLTAPQDARHAAQSPSSSPMPLSLELTDSDGHRPLTALGRHHHHHHEPWLYANRGESRSASDRVDDGLDCVPLQVNVNHPPSTSATSIEPISSPDDEAPLSMSDSSSQPSVSPPLQAPPTHQQPLLLPITKPKLARVSSDPVHPSSLLPLSHQHHPAPLPSGNRPAGTPLPSHMHRQPTMDPSHHQPTAGPSTSSSRSTRYADPDSHWLSEDEGEIFLDDTRNKRQSPRKRGGPRLQSSYPVSSFNHPDDDDDNNSHGGKNSLLHGGDGEVKRRFRNASSVREQEDLYVDSSIADPVAVSSSVSQPPRRPEPAPSDARRQHQAIRPSPSAESSSPPRHDLESNAAFKDYAPFIKDLSAITPNLVKALTCPSCQKLMSDPTTLACGHSECLLCVAPQAASVLLRKTSPTSAPIAITAAVLTMPDDGNRHDENALRLPTPALYSASHLEASSEQKSPRATLADGVCPVPTCKKVTKATGNGRQGLRVDVVLQKLAFLLRSRVALDRQDDLQEAEGRRGSHSNAMIAPTPRHRSPDLDTLLDVEEVEEEGSWSEPILRVSPQSPRLSRSRSFLRSSSPGAAGYLHHSNEREGAPSNTSSPDEETKSEDNAKRGMKTRSYSKSAGRTSKKSRSGFAGVTKRQSQAGLPMLVTDILSELECHICVTMMYDPVTTTCGHTFCKKCLLRSLDHSNRCPLCRTELPGMSYFIHAPINFTLSNLLITTFPILYEQRKDLLKQEENDSGLDTPIFVCMVAFPFMPTNLHIYEPRYRLMMRRALDTNKRFGMVLPSRQAGSGGFAQYGTMLEIRNMHVFEDGRSLVETVGVSRFKVLENGTLDGYTVGKIERIDDIGDEEEAELERSAIARSTTRAAEERQAARSASPPSLSIGVIDEKANSPSGATSHHRDQHHHQSSSTLSSRSATGLRSLSFSRHRSSSFSSSNANNSSNSRRVTPPTQNIDPAGLSANPNDASASDAVELTNAELVDICKGFVEALRTGSTPWLLQRLNDSLPPMPEDHREFTWWMAMLMPIDDHEKARLIQITSYRLRLRLLVFWIQQMQHSWWFSRGCTIA